MVASIVTIGSIPTYIASSVNIKYFVEKFQYNIPEARLEGQMSS